MEALDEGFVLNLDLLWGGGFIQPQGVKRLSFGIADAAGGLAGDGGILAQHGEGVAHACIVAIAAGGGLFSRPVGGPAIFAQFPSGAVAGAGVFLPIQHRAFGHAVEVIIGLVVVFHVVEAKMHILAFHAPALGCLMQARLAAFGPFAYGVALGLALGAPSRLDADLIEIF